MEVLFYFIQKSISGFSTSQIPSIYECKNSIIRSKLSLSGISGRTLIFSIAVSITLVASCSLVAVLVRVSRALNKVFYIVPEIVA